MKLIINGGNPLSGTINAGLSKNATLPIIAASFLFDRKTHFKKVPKVTDVQTLIELGGKMGGEVSYSYEGNGLILCQGKIKTADTIPIEAQTIRAGYYLIPAALERGSSVSCPLPGGCNFSKRKIDYHVSVFEEFGFCVNFSENRMHVNCSGRPQKDDHIIDVHESMGASVNALLMAVKMKKKITIINPCNDLEFRNLTWYIEKQHESRCFNYEVENWIGKKPSWKAKWLKMTYTPEEFISAEEKMLEPEIIGDRIEDRTYEALSHMLPDPSSIIRTYASSKIIDTEDNQNFIKHLKEFPSKIIVDRYPKICTDYMPLLAAVYISKKKPVEITDPIYPDRPWGLLEFKNFGADIRIDNKKAIINPRELHAGCARAQDLRLGAALTMLALTVPGRSIILDFEQVLRGYENIVDKLQEIGADITLVD